MSSFFKQTAETMIAKDIDRFPLLKIQLIIDWQPIANYLEQQKGRFWFIESECAKSFEGDLYQPAQSRQQASCVYCCVKRGNMPENRELGIIGNDGEI